MFVCVFIFLSPVNGEAQCVLKVLAITVLNFRERVREIERNSKRARERESDQCFWPGFKNLQQGQCVGYTSSDSTHTSLNCSSGWPCVSLCVCVSVCVGDHVCVYP